jgi:thiol-disulfide isomerase/thioredoxin
MPRPTETANLYEPESLDDFSEILKNNEKVVVYFYNSFNFECKFTKPIIRSLAYKYKDILFFLVNVDRHKVSIE